MPNFHLGHALTGPDTWLHPIDSLRIDSLRRGEHDQTRCRVLRRRTTSTGVLTFLFTDIEGSTRRWEADPGGMMIALELHNRVLLDVIETHGGVMFSYTGDGMCAAFASPARAVHAAVAAQRGLNLPVRMGVATGEVQRRGDDYYGPVLNRAARVMAAGHGGQILLDGATTALLDGVDVMGLGSRRLRDIARPVELFQVRASGLRIDFPPLKTADPTPGNLRPGTDSFIGREKDLTETQIALDSHRLVTLTGVGGVGKTRLALELAGRLAHESVDEVWVIELGSISDPTAVPEAVAAVLGLPHRPGTSLAETVATALAGRSVLMVFDNCEHLLDCVGKLIEAILARSAETKILATSRERLALAGEQLRQVNPLPTGPDSAAAALFRDRAHAVAHDISIHSPYDSAVVVEICRRADGIPLAIELAAARLASMTLTELRDRLDDPLRLLVGSCRTVERHRTLRQAVQWSYDLLDSAEKSLFALCSAFTNGFSLAEISAISTLDDEYAVLERLDALVRKSLLVVDRTSAVTRFSMLGSIREFGEEQLAACGDTVEILTALNEPTCATP